MDLKRIKTVIIVILLIINVFFAYNLVIEYRDRYYIEDGVTEDAVNILSGSGISIDPDTIPKKKMTQHVYEGTFGDDHNEKVAKLLAGADIESAFSIPDGMRFVAKNGVIVEISDDLDIVMYGEHADRYTAFSGIIDSAANSFERVDPPAMSERIKEMLASDLSPVEGYVDMGAECTSAYYDAKTGYCILVFSQTLDSLPLYGHELWCIFEGEELLYMQGNWTFLATDKKYSSQLNDQINILFVEKKNIDGMRSENEDLSVSLEIETLDTVYCTYLNNDKTGLYFIPAWRITYADGREAVYDAHSGMQYVEK